MRRLKTLATWMLQIFVGCLFMLVAVRTFVDPRWAEDFARWGYPNGFYLVVGAIEAAGGALLLIPSLATYAALTLMSIMVAAGLTRVVYHETRFIVAPVVLLAMCTAVAWLRRSNRWRALAQGVSLEGGTR